MKKDYIFTEELRNRMSKFGDMDVTEALKSPDFFNELMVHAGMDINQIKDLWIKIGREDISDAIEEDL